MLIIWILIQFFMGDVVLSFPKDTIDAESNEKILFTSNDVEIGTHHPASYFAKAKQKSPYSSIRDLTQNGPLLTMLMMLVGTLAAGWFIQYLQFRAVTRTQLKIYQEKELLSAERDYLVSKLADEREINQFKQELTDMIVHDLKSPLDSIIGLISLQGANTTIKAGIRSKAEFMRNMVLNILDIRKYQSKSLPLNVEKVSLRDMVEESRTHLNFYLERKKVHLNNEIPEDLIAQIDPLLFKRVINNILSNAAKYSPKGSTISVLSDIAEGNLKISVADQGPGIPASQQESIFEPYHSSDKNYRYSDYSTGLGLAFSKLVVEAHKGDISVQSTDAKGATFVISLPTENA